MRLEAVELRRIQLPLVSPFRTSFGTQGDRDILLVRALTDAGEGWGECVAPASPLYSSEYVDGAQHVTREHLLPLLFAHDRPLSGDLVAGILSPVRGHRMAKAAIEMAVLDAELRARGESFTAHLGGIRDSVDCGVSVGIAESPGALVDMVRGYLDAGYRRIKLKIEPGADIDRVAAVRAEFPGIPLQVDANAAYSPADGRHLSRLDEFDLLLIEQPLPEEEVAAHADLARLLTTPICLDESITSARAAADAIALGACSIVNVKAGRVGGYLEARRVHDVCAAMGVSVWCGGMLETGLGRAANVALAALPGFTLTGDISASARYYAEDITEPFEMVDGRLAVPTGPGLGVTVDLARLKEVTTSVETVPAR